MAVLVTLKVEGHMQSSKNLQITRTIHRRPRERKAIPPQDQRSWLLLVEAAVLIGCSHATIHRLRRGEIEGIPRLPAVQVGKRKWVVLKTSLEQWQREMKRFPPPDIFEDSRKVAQRRTQGVR
jgi:hypothetical protein